MKRPARNIIIGVALGILAAAAALIIVLLLSRQPSGEERLEAARAPLAEARALDEQAASLARAGKAAEAGALRLRAKAKYDEAVSLFDAIYRDLKLDQQTRLTAAYHIGIVRYAQGTSSASEEQRREGVSRLLPVIQDSKDSLERFEACRVIASWNWDNNDIGEVLKILGIVQDNKEMLSQLNDLLYSIRNSRDGRLDMDFLVEHKEFGLAADYINSGVFTDDDQRFWTYSRLYRFMADEITGGATGPDAVGRLFDWCRRNIATLPEDKGRLVSLPPHQALFAGHGAVTERTWAFCVLLKSLYMYKRGAERCDYDVLVIRAGGSTLVSAWDGERTRLYDMDMCLPVYGADGATPVTLADVRSGDVRLSTGLEGVAYPYDSARIRKGTYFIPFDPRSAAFREALLLPNSFLREPLLHRTMRDYRPLYQSAVTELESAVRGYFLMTRYSGLDVSVVLARARGAVRAFFFGRPAGFDYPYHNPDGGVLKFWDAPFDENRLATLDILMKSSKQGEPEPKQVSELGAAERKRLDEYDAARAALQANLKLLSGGRQLYVLGRYADAVEWFETNVIDVVKESENPAALENARYFRSLALVGDAIASAGAEKPAALADAEKALKDYIETYPNGAWKDCALFNLGLVCREMGKTDDAKRRFAQVNGSLEYPAGEQIKQLASPAP